MVVSDPAAGKVLATPAIGEGVDGVAFDDGYAFSANGKDGNITMVGETSPGKYEPIATIPTQPGANDRRGPEGTQTVSSGRRIWATRCPQRREGGA